MSFVFFGTSRFSTIVLDELKRAGLKPSLIVSAPDKTAGRGLKVTAPPVKIWAEKNNIPCLQPASLKSPDVISQLQTTNYELFIIAAYGKIIPKAVLDIPKHGTLNVHPSLLPRYRGPTPIQSAIMAGDQETGVTIMLVDEELDHGPIVAQQRLEFSISNFQFSKLQEILAEVSGKLLAEVAPKWIAGKIKAVPQDHSQATFTRKFTTEDAFIEPAIVGQIQTPDVKDPQTSGVEEAYRKVLALNPEPGSWTELAGKRVKIIGAKLEGGKFVTIKVIPAGRREMSWDEFLRGYRMA